MVLVEEEEISQGMTDAKETISVCPYERVLAHG